MLQSKVFVLQGCYNFLAVVSPFVAQVFVKVTESVDAVPNSTYMWYPVFVPQIVGGFFPVCPAAANVSSHAPVAGDARAKPSNC